MEQFKQGFVVALAAGAALASAPASAEFYAGGSVGEGTVEASDSIDGQSLDFEGSDTAFKVFGGYMFNDYIGVEAAFLDMGSLDDSIGFDGGEVGPVRANVDAELSGFTAQVVGQFPIDDLDLFAKAGMIMYDIEGDLDITNANGDRLLRDSVDSDGEELIYGVGARYNFGQLGVRAEYEVIDADDIDDAYVWSIGLEYSFPM